MYKTEQQFIDATKMLKHFRAFLEDETAWEMFITGQAGTGKTTMLHDLVLYSIAQNIPYIVCAFTHKACGVLKDKLPLNAEIETLHKYLKKWPNTTATKRKYITISAKQGESERKTIMFLDEYSTVGEKDYLDIGNEQDPEYTGKPAMKVVYVGDSNQLPPLLDQTALYPNGEYNYKLTKVYRQAEDNPLINILTQLVSFMEGATLEPLIESSSMIRGVDIVKKYRKERDYSNSVLLAFTDKRVQEMNFGIKDKSKPRKGDSIYSPTLRHHYKFISVENTNSYIDRIFDGQLTFNSKYKTLEHLIRMNCCKFMRVMDEDGDEYIFAVVFGHYNYKLVLEALQEAAVFANKTIEAETTVKAKVWAVAHPRAPLARARAKAWRDYITFKDCVVCMDFPYAMTVHKSQGSTFDTVYVDTQDLGTCADNNYNLYLKLFYNAISRASNKVYTN